VLLRASVVPSISSRYTTTPAAAKTAIPTQKIRVVARLRFGVIIILVLSSFALSLSQERNGGTTLPPPARRRFCRRWWWCFIERRFCRLARSEKKGGGFFARFTRESNALGKKLDL